MISLAAALLLALPHSAKAEFGLVVPPQTKHTPRLERERPDSVAFPAPPPVITIPQIQPSMSSSQSAAGPSGGGFGSPPPPSIPLVVDMDFFVKHPLPELPVPSDATPDSRERVYGTGNFGPGGSPVPRDASTAALKARMLKEWGEKPGFRAALEDWERKLQDYRRRNRVQLELLEKQLKATSIPELEGLGTILIPGTPSFQALRRRLLREFGDIPGYRARVEEWERLSTTYYVLPAKPAASLVPEKYFGKPAKTEAPREEIDRAAELLAPLAKPSVRTLRRPVTRLYHYATRGTVLHYLRERGIRADVSNYHRFANEYAAELVDSFNTEEPFGDSKGFHLATDPVTTRSFGSDFENPKDPAVLVEVSVPAGVNYLAQADIISDLRGVKLPKEAAELLDRMGCNLWMDVFTTRPSSYLNCRRVWHKVLSKLQVDLLLTEFYTNTNAPPDYRTCSRQGTRFQARLVNIDRVPKEGFRAYTEHDPGSDEAEMIQVLLVRGGAEPLACQRQPAERKGPAARTTRLFWNGLISGDVGARMSEDRRQLRHDVTDVMRELWAQENLLGCGGYPEDFYGREKREPVRTDIRRQDSIDEIIRQATIRPKWPD